MYTFVCSEELNVDEVALEVVEEPPTEGGGDNEPVT